MWKQCTVSSRIHDEAKSNPQAAKQKMQWDQLINMMVTLPDRMANKFQRKCGYVLLYRLSPCSPPWYSHIIIPYYYFESTPSAEQLRCTAQCNHGATRQWWYCALSLTEILQRYSVKVSSYSALFAVRCGALSYSSSNFNGTTHRIARQITRSMY